MSEYLIPLSSLRFTSEEPQLPEANRMLVLYAEYLMDLVKKNYTGELKTNIRYIFQKIDDLEFEDVKKNLIKIILADIQDSLLYDSTDDYLGRVGDKLRILKGVAQN